MIKVIPIKDLKEKEIFWLLKNFAISINEIWGSGFSYGSDEVDAEYKLAVARSRRLKDEIDEFINLDLELGWGCSRTVENGTTYIRKTGDFNPWYQGDLTLNELVDSLEPMYLFHFGIVDAEDFEIKFIHFYEQVQKVLDKMQSPKKNENVDFFWSLIHHDIETIAKQRFNSGHYADAVEASLKHVNSLVKSIVRNKTGLEFDGADLMSRAFSVRDPIIQLDDLEYETGKNIQVGYMQIFSGSMTGIRNPKAHENITIDKTRAVHFLFLSSLLLCKLEECGALESSKETAKNLKKVN